MKNSWTKTFRRLAAATVVAGTTAFSSAMCYAQIAADNASDPVYNNGWQAGDNGGFGFGPWNFDGTYTANPTPPPGSINNPGAQQAMDDGLRTGTQASSPHNNIGRSWTLFNPLGPTPGPEANDGTDISRAGRSAPLQVGRTLSMTVDSPTERNFFRGFTIRLLSGGANTCYAGDNCTTPAFDPGSISTRASIGTFEYFTDGRWFDNSNSSTLTDVNTSDGVQIDISVTGNNYVVKMTSPGNPVYVNSGPLGGAGAIDWVSVDYFGTDSDTYPTLKSPRGETDFFIRSMSIRQGVIPEPATASLILAGASGVLLAGARSRKRD